MPRLDSITIKGFRSIRSLENFELKSLNILVGGNGAGKSNFIDFFHVIIMVYKSFLPENSLDFFHNFININGGADAFLHNGINSTEQISLLMAIDNIEYNFTLYPTLNHTLTIGENNLPKDMERVFMISEIFKPYHFCYTNIFSSLLHQVSIFDNAYLRHDGKNIAPFLLKIKNEYPDHYKKIIRYIRLIAPFFYDFTFTPIEKEKVWLDWKQKNSDYPMRPYQFSDGTLRFIALVTALLQPNPPAVMLIDEPELGLHPEAIRLLAHLIQLASQKSQIIVATQSPTLLDCFAPEDIVVVKRKDGQSVFERLNEEEYKAWLDEYTLGDLWSRGIVRGGAEYE